MSTSTFNNNTEIITNLKEYSNNFDYCNNKTINLKSRKSSNNSDFEDSQCKNVLNNNTNTSRNDTNSTISNSSNLVDNDANNLNSDNKTNYNQNDITGNKLNKNIDLINKKYIENQSNMSLCTEKTTSNAIIEKVNTYESLCFEIKKIEQAISNLENLKVSKLSKIEDLRLLLSRIASENNYTNMSISKSVNSCNTFKFGAKKNNHKHFTMVKSNNENGYVHNSVKNKYKKNRSSFIRNNNNNDDDSSCSRKDCMQHLTSCYDLPDGSIQNEFKCFDNDNQLYKNYYNLSKNCFMYWQCFLPSNSVQTLSSLCNKA